MNKVLQQDYVESSDYRKYDDLNITERIDIIYEIFDNLICTKQYSKIEVLLSMMDPKCMPLDDALSILTVTLTSKSFLPMRAIFLKLVQKRCDIQDSNLLVGL